MENHSGKHNSKSYKSKDFDKRLSNLKAKVNKKKGANISEASGVKIVADIISGLIVGGFIGYFTDKFLNTSPIFLMLFIVFGFFVGMYIFYQDLNRKQNPKSKRK